MENIYLTDITGTLGEWLDKEFVEVPNQVVNLLTQAYNLAATVATAVDKLGKYNQILRDTYGEYIDIEIEYHIEDNKIYYYNSLRYYNTIKEAYEDADYYLKHRRVRRKV